MLLLALLLASDLILLNSNWLTPISVAIFCASESEISLGALSEVFTPIIPSWTLTFILYFNSFIIPGRSSENVKSVPTTILLPESSAIPLLLKRSFLLGSIGLSSWIFKV